MEARKMYFIDCNLAGRQYHDADEVWDELKVGTVLRLERDKDNRHDPYAVAVMYKKGDEDEPYCIGYLPRKDNKTVAIILEMGWKDVFECRICKINEEAHSENQVGMTIKIKKNNIK